MAEEEEEGGGTAAAVEAELGLRRTRRAGLLLWVVLAEGASMRAEKEEEACRAVVVDWGMRVPARRTATPGGGIRKAWVCVSPMAVRARRVASRWRRDVVRLCMLLLLLLVVVVALVLLVCSVLSRSLIRLTDFSEVAILILILCL